MSSSIRLFFPLLLVLIVGSLLSPLGRPFLDRSVAWWSGQLPQTGAKTGDTSSLGAVTAESGADRKAMVAGVWASAPAGALPARQNESPLGPLELIPSPLAASSDRVPPDAIWSDRVVYAPNDPLAQVIVVSQSLSKAAVGSLLKVSLIDSQGNELDTREFVIAEGQPAFLVAGKMDVSLLPAGDYSLSAGISPPDGVQKALVGSKFSVSSQPRFVASFPVAGIPLIVPPVAAAGSTVAPVSFGAPLAYGAIGHDGSLEVWEDGKPIQTQSRPLAFWGPGEDASVRWMGISFLARYQDGKAGNYVLKKGASPSTAPLTVSETDDAVRIDTGALSFTISKKQFRGPENISLTGSQGAVNLPGAGSAGAYVVDEQGRRYEAAAGVAPEVKIDERGPARAAVSVRGWYADPSNPDNTLCQYQIRIYAYAGLARIDGFQRTIITYDTRAKKLADVGFSLPASPSAGGAVQWMAGIDGATRQGEADPKGDVFFAQAGPDAVWLNETTGEPAGKRSDGWLAINGGPLITSGFLRDVWEKFPKEISYSGGLMTFHSWPKHGRRIVTPEEEITRENIHRNLFAHQGPLLDLQLPESYFNQLQQWNTPKQWDRENTAAIGFRSTGGGVSMSIRFGIEYFPAETPVEAVAAQSNVNQIAPAATTDPQWNAASGVIPFITAAGDPRWEKSDNLLEAFVIGMNNIAAAGNAYGMWIYGNTNNNWDTTIKAPFLHRVWQNSHYGHASFPWKYYFRSGNPEFLKMARAQTGNLMDVGIVHAVPPGEVGVYAGKWAGSLYHAKGWLPWGVRLRGEFPTDSDAGTLQHWTNPKVFLERYLAEVDLEALDVFNLWYNLLVNSYRYRAHYCVGRELTQSISELLDIYQTFWDPRLVGYLRPMADSALGTPFRNYQSQLGFAFFNRTWPIRYFDFARDPKVIERLEESLPTENFGPYGMASAAFLLHERKQLDRAPRLLSVIENADRNVFRSPGDPLDGFGSFSSAVDSRTLDEIPAVQVALAALSPAELDKIRQAGVPVDPVFPARSGRVQVRKGTEAALVLALNPDGRAFKLRVESLMGVDMLPGMARIIAPDGKEIQQIPLHTKSADGKPRILRYLGEGAPVFDIPGGLPGVYRIEFYGHFPIYRAPMTDLPNEISELGQGSQAVNGFLFAPRAKQLTLNFAAGKPAGAARPQNFFVKNLNGSQIFQTNLLFGSSRAVDSTELQGGPEGVRAEVRLPNLTWAPTTQTVFFAHRWKDFAPVLKQLGAQLTTLAAPAATAPAAKPAAPEE